MYGIKGSDLDLHSLLPSHLGTELRRFTQIVPVGDIVADSDAIKVPLFKPASAITIKRILMGFDTAIVAADTNYQTYKVTDGTNTIATVSTGPASTGQAFSAGAFVELTLVSTYVGIAATETVKLEFTKVGSGMTGSNCVIQIDYTIDDPA